MRNGVLEGGRLYRSGGHGHAGGRSRGGFTDHPASLWAALGCGAFTPKSVVNR